MAYPTSVRKTFTVGEGGLVIVFTALALASLVIAGKAWTTAYSFHALLFAVGSALAVFKIVERFLDRPAGLPPREIDGKPNYIYGPIKFATVAGVFWASPALPSACGSRWNSPSPASTSICNGSISAACARCTRPP